MLFLAAGLVIGVKGKMTYSIGATEGLLSALSVGYSLV
jgi:hypothetical protein